MQRRRLLQTVSAGAAGALAGCADSLGILNSGGGCGLTAIDGFSSIWSSPNVGPNARHVTGSFDADAALDTGWTERFDATTASPLAATGETLLVSHADSTTVLDAETGERKWELPLRAEAGATDLAPPDGTSDHDWVRQIPWAAADGTGYVSVGYYAAAGSTVSAAVFALDAADGSVEWSAATAGQRVLRVDAAGRLYGVGNSDALSRSSVDERTLTDGAWGPEPRSEIRVHADAWNARTGDDCWTWDVEAPSDVDSGFGMTSPAVASGHLGVTARTGDVLDRTTELYVLDAASGDETGSMSLSGELYTMLGVGDRLVCGSETPPEEDGPTDGPTLFAVDLDAAELDWQVASPGGISAATDESVVATGEGRIERVGAESGDELWSQETDDSVACIAGDALVTQGETALRTRSLDDGSVRATTDLGAPILHVAAADGRFYVECESDEPELVALE